MERDEGPAEAVGRPDDLTPDAVLDANSEAHQRSCAAEFIVSHGREVDVYRLSVVHVGERLVLRVYCPACGRLLEEHAAFASDRGSWHRVGVTCGIPLRAGVQPRRRLHVQPDAGDMAVGFDQRCSRAFPGP